MTLAIYGIPCGNLCFSKGQQASQRIVILGPELNIYQGLTRSVQHVFHSSGKSETIRIWSILCWGAFSDNPCVIGVHPRRCCKHQEYDQETFKVRLSRIPSFRSNFFFDVKPGLIGFLSRVRSEQARVSEEIAADASLDTGEPVQETSGPCEVITKLKVCLYDLHVAWESQVQWTGLSGALFWS